MERRRLVVPGGGGFLGRTLASWFSREGWEVVVLSRREEVQVPGARIVRWDGKTAGPWHADLEGAAALVNLAGRSVNCRYTPRNRQVIYDSRLHSTRALGEALARCDSPPPVWINASSATIYRHAEDRAMDEETGELGTGFSVDVCRRWEEELFRPELPRTRRVALRAAMVFGREPGGVFDAFYRLARLGLGGTQGPGTQYVSWIHAEDFARSVEWLIQREDLSGPVNCAAPHPLPNREFLRRLRQACGVPVGLPAARWMLEIGAIVLGTETELLLKSRRVVPGRLLASGFAFRYPEWAEAAAALVRGT